MKRAIVWTGATLLAGLAAWQAASALQDTPDAPASTSSAATTAPVPAAEQKGTSSAPAPTKAKPPAPLPESKASTPMAERVATIGVLNKRNGLSRDLTMKPGEAVRIGDLVVRLRACEATAPWESERWTAPLSKSSRERRARTGARPFPVGCIRKARRSTSSSTRSMMSGLRPARCGILILDRARLSRAVTTQAGRRDPGLKRANQRLSPLPLLLRPTVPQTARPNNPPG